MNVAIIGGTGFIGRYVAERLLLRGVTPVVIARGQHPVLLPWEVLFRPADRMDRDAVSRILCDHNIEVVIDIFALGMLNTKTVFEAMAERGGRYVLLSSVDVYRNYGGLLRREEPPIQWEPARETDPLRTFRYPYRGNPRRPQGVEQALFEDYDKIVLEEAALADGRFSTTVIRAPMIFGPGDKQNRFGWAIGAAKRGGVVEIDQRAMGWRNSYGFAVDVADAMVTAALDGRAAGQIFNVGQSHVRTPAEWIELFAAVLGTHVAVRGVPPEAKGLLWERAEASDLRYPLTLDTSRIRQELGWTEPTAERDALLRTVLADGESALAAR